MDVSYDRGCPTLGHLLLFLREIFIRNHLLLKLEELGPDKNGGPEAEIPLGEKM